jgi:hypothetical protein
MRLLLQISVMLLSLALTLSYSGQSACFVGSNKGSRRVARAQRTTTTRVLGRKSPTPEPGYSFSYVDGDNFENAEDEVLAMGGDPFFLQDDSKDEGPPGASNLQVDPDPAETGKFLWDGEVDEDAHLDLY